MLFMTFSGVEGSGSGRGIKEGADVRRKKGRRIEDRRPQGLTAGRDCSRARINVHSPRLAWQVGYTGP